MLSLNPLKLMGHHIYCKLNLQRSHTREHVSKFSSLIKARQSLFFFSEGVLATKINTKSSDSCCVPCSFIYWLLKSLTWSGLSSANQTGRIIYIIYRHLDSPQESLNLNLIRFYSLPDLRWRDFGRFLCSGARYTAEACTAEKQAEEEVSKEQER